MPAAAPPPLFIVDAFADGPFTGNPAAVVVLRRDDSLSGWPDAAWMQRLAEEMNLSETAFILPPSEDESADANRPGAAFGLRWFTPEAEVELCGHATLASAHVLFHEHERDQPAGDFPRPEHTIHFQTRYAGVLTCQRDEHHHGHIAMDFPAQRCHPVDTPAGLFETLRVCPDDVAAVSYGPYDFILELTSPEAVTKLDPDFAALAAFDARGVAVTAAVPRDHPEALNRYRDAAVVSRFFAPSLRIAEDPVTGSLHCVLATYWSKRLGKTRWRAYQDSARRGVLQITLREHDQRVDLAGRAFTILRGTLA